MWIPLEVNLGIGSLRSKAASTTSSVWNRHKVILHPSLCIKPVLMLLGVHGWVLLGVFFFSVAIGKCCHPRNPSVVLEQPCVHQNRFIVESFRFLVPMFFKVFENDIFDLKRFRSNGVLVVYGHEMI